jgi:hypothetical protein
MAKLRVAIIGCGLIKCLRHFTDKYAARDDFQEGN